MNSTTRPEFMTPKPTSPKGSSGTKPESILGKRKYQDAFDAHDDERYGQPIESDFFTSNIGHGVYQEAADGAIADLHSFLSKDKLQALSISCGSIDEMIAWCEMYCKLGNK